ncbi:angiopoietin-related protein 6 isoform X3 [Chelonia mydas]|uniref:angiopoietin-related protein 6 isoform X3 n=1 Tax=Chelonia mydas TaxID=8469 RepID=UPI0018A1DBD3|nr:angiopoietin-related protein 6 isoform X3 [Chelonia mydas]
MAGGAARGPAAPAQRRAAMERQEQSGPAGAAEPGESPEAQFQAVVQRTQVLLLAGETWEADRARAALSSFAHEVLPVARRAASPAPPSAPPAGQLVFFLCRAPSLRGRAARLREVLRGVREQSRGAPAALVGVIVQPRPEEEAEARRRLEELLLEVFQPPESGPGAAPRVEVHTAVFRPGRPEGALEVKKAACEALREEPAWPKDCSEITWNRVSGVFVIQPTGLHQFEVYCDLNSTSEGWTVLQRNRHDTQITWAESWSTYKYGFGNVHNDYWLGTEYIYQIAKQKVYQVRFVIHDSSGTMKYADYNLFGLEDESKGYRLRLGSYTGTAGDAMTSNNPSTVHDNMKFSTKDLDQDTYSGNCASSYGGGWWYSACYSAQLNTKGSITWGSVCSGNCQASAILIKPATYC